MSAAEKFFFAAIIIFMGLVAAMDLLLAIALAHY